MSATSATMQAALKRVAEFSVAHQEHQMLLKERKVKLVDRRASPRSGVMGEWLTLVQAITDTTARLQPGEGTPKREDFKDALNDDYLAAAEGMRIHVARPVNEAAEAAIRALRALAKTGEWPSSPPTEHAALYRLEIVAAVADIVPMLDMFDTRYQVGTASQGTDAARFLYDVLEGRPSIMDPTVITDISETLPFHYDSRGQPNTTITPEIKSFLSKQTGKPAPDNTDLFTWMVRAQTKLLSLANVVTNLPSQRAQADAAAEALFTAYTKLLFNADLLLQIDNFSSADAKLEELGEVVASWGVTVNPPTKALEAQKGLKMAGVPLQMIDGLLKVSNSIQKFNRSTNSGTDTARALEAAAAASEGITQGFKLIAEALETFGSTATKKTAKRALAYLALPLLAFELAATVKGLSDAVRNNDLSVATGHVLLGIGAVAATAITMYAEFAVTAAVAGGPVGAGAAVAGGLVLAITLVGIYLVEFTKDPPLETFAEVCAFGKRIGDWTDASPGAVQFGFGAPAALDCATQTERLYSLQHSIGFTAKITSGHILRLSHRYGKTDQTLPSQVRTACRYIGDPAREDKSEVVPGFNDELFRNGVVAIEMGGVPPEWGGKWLRLEVSWADDNRLPKTIEYARIP